MKNLLRLSLLFSLWVVLNHGFQSQAASVSNGVKTLNLQELLTQTSDDFVGINRLIVRDVPGLRDLVIENPRADIQHGLLSDGRGYVFWNKWGSVLNIIDAEVKEGLLELKVVFAPNIPIKGEFQQPLEATSIMKIGTDGVAEAGFRFQVATANMGPLQVRDFFVEYVPPSQVGGGALFALGKNGKGFGGEFLLKNGMVDTIKIAANNLDIPLGNSGAKLDAVNGGVVRLQEPPWAIEGGFVIVVGPSKAGPVWPMEISANGQFRQDGRIEIRGNAKLMGLAVGDAYVFYAPAFDVDAGASINFLDIVVGSADLQLRSSNFAGKVYGRVQVPRHVPAIGGWTLASAYAYFAINPSYYELGGSVGVNVTPEIPAWCIPGWCFPCVYYCYPCGWSWCSGSWCPPCVPPICFPRIPPWSINFGFKVRNGAFSFSTLALDGLDDTDVMTQPGIYQENPQVWPASPWEKSWRPQFPDPEGRFVVEFLTNFRQIGKVSTTPDYYLTQPMRVTRIEAPKAAAGVVRSAVQVERVLHTGTVTVPKGKPEVGVRIHWGDTVVLPPDDLAFSVTLPDGTEVPLDDEDALDELAGKGITLFLDYDDVEKMAWVFILDAPPGDYDVNVEASEELTELTYDLIQEDEEPVIEIDEPYVDEEDNSLVFWWKDLDIDSSATVELSLVHDRKDVSGYVLFKTSEDDPQDSDDLSGLEDYDELFDEGGLLHGWEMKTFLLDEIQVPPGDYYAMATISDGINKPIKTISATAVKIGYGHPGLKPAFHNPKLQGIGPLAAVPLPDQVKGVRSRPEPTGFTIAWEAVTNTVVTGYVVEYSTNAIPGAFEFSTPANADALTLQIKDLKPGSPYLVQVRAVGLEGIQGPPSEVHTVIPSPGFGRTPPVIRTTAGVVAFPGLLYSYFPGLFDGDMVHLNNTNTVGHVNHGPNGEPLPDMIPGYEWKLVRGPAGMSLDASGIVTWKPTQEQLGTNEFVILAVEKAAETLLDRNLAATLRVAQTNQVVVLDPESQAKPVPIPATRYHARRVQRSGLPTPPQAPKAKNYSGLKDIPFSFLSRPPLYVSEGEKVDYSISYNADPKQVTLELLQGPAGMKLDLTNHLVWTVPVGAQGARVVVRASVKPAADADTEQFLQEFFLPVHRVDNRLTSPAEILLEDGANEAGPKVRWRSRDADPSALPRAYKIQMSTALDGEVWVDVTPEIPVDRAAAIKSFEALSLEYSLPKRSENTFYRVINLD